MRWLMFVVPAILFFGFIPFSIVLEEIFGQGLFFFCAYHSACTKKSSVKTLVREFADAARISVPRNKTTSLLA